MRTFSSVPTRRAAALFSASALAATALIATAGPAGAAVTSSGQNDPVTGFPTYMVDDQGLALQMCLDACIEPAEPGEVPEVADPNHAPYFAAEATVGQFTVEYSVATDQEDPAVPGVLANSAVVRSGVDVAPGATYRVRGPWGAFNVQADDRGRVAADVPNAVQGFLRRPNATGEMLGLPEEATSRVVGSPTGFNRVTITGPGVNASSNQFVLIGQKAPNLAMTTLGSDALAMGNGTSARPVTRPIRYTNIGTAAATPTAVVQGPNAARFSVDTSSCASVAPGNACNIRVTYRPQNNRNAAARLRITDNSLAAARVVTLRGTGNDTLRARVASSTPRRGQRVGVKKNVSVRFNEAVRGVKKSSFQVVNQRSGNRIAGRVSRVGQTNRYVFNPRRDLARGTSYRVRLVGGQAAIRDLAGNPLRSKTWRFRTR